MSTVIRLPPIGRDGFPRWTRQGVEAVARRFLVKYAPHTLSAPEPLGIASVMKALQDAKKVRFVLSESLGTNSQGHRYLGRYDIRNRVIFIDSRLVSGDPRFAFTVAHELGHFALHSRIVPGVIPMDQIWDTTRDITLARMSGRGGVASLEFQANVFAAAILVPPEQFSAGVVATQRALGVQRDLGMVWVDAIEAQDREFTRTVAAIASRYEVSRKVIRIRLEEFGLIRRRGHRREPVQVRDLLASVLDHIESNVGQAVESQYESAEYMEEL